MISKDVYNVVLLKNKMQFMYELVCICPCNYVFIDSLYFFHKINCTVFEKLLISCSTSIITQIYLFSLEKTKVSSQNIKF